MSMALPSDVPSATSDRRSFLTMIENTTKPVVFTAWDETGLADIIAMAEAVAGGAEQLSLNPFLLAYLEPSSPLQHSKTVLAKMMIMADKRLPFVYAPGPVEGASAPVTSAGSLVMANAEILSGITIAQLRRCGTPVVYGSGSGPLDMRTTVATYSSPEFMLHCKAFAELGQRFYHLPTWGFSGCTDSKVPDAQAGADSALWILWTALSGNNLVHDIGYVESGMTCSHEMIVMCDEIISFVRGGPGPGDDRRGRPGRRLPHLRSHPSPLQGLLVPEGLRPVFAPVLEHGGQPLDRRYRAGRRPEGDFHACARPAAGGNPRETARAGSGRR
jgi:trimethylamine--corrinoid protein Co-methyltransferase